MKKLAHPPIEQAAIEVIVELPPGKNFAELSPVVEALSPLYPQKKNLRRQAIELQINHKSAPKSEYKDLGEVGWQLSSADGRKGMQIRLDGVLLTQSGEYEDWESCYEDFGKAIHIYFEVMTPLKIKRASSRFINRLGLSIGKPFEEMLKIPLPLPAGFDEAKISNIVSRVSFKDPIGGLQGTVILMADGVKPSLVLDIDVADLEPGQLSVSDLKLRFDKLREFKNLLFQNSLTEKQLEVYR